MASGIVVIITAWCIQMRGPLFASVFNPLMLVLVAIAGSLMLNENLYVGRYVVDRNSPFTIYTFTLMNFNIWVFIYTYYS